MKSTRIRGESGSADRGAVSARKMRYQLAIVDAAQVHELGASRSA